MLKRISDLGAAPASMQQLFMESGLNVPSMRALSPLPEDAQRVIDNAVVEVGLDRLTIVADIMAAGLTMPLDDPLSVMEVQWEKVARAGFAQRTMAPQARGEDQLPKRAIARIPIYLTTDDFSLNIRTLKMSQRIGQPLDTSLIKAATRNVNEAIEDALINGAGVQVEGYTTPGLINAPNVYQYSFSSNEAWTASGHDGADILGDVQGMIAALQGRKKWGPYHIYVPTTYGHKLNVDYSTQYPQSIWSRLRELAVNSDGKFVIKVADLLPADTVVMFQMTDDVVDIIDGMAPTVFPWTSIDGFVLFWMVMAIQVPRVRTDYDSNTGILVGKPSW